MFPSPVHPGYSYVFTKSLFYFVSKMEKRVNIRKKLIAVCSALAIVPLLIATGLLSSVATKDASIALETAANHQLVAIRATKKAQIEDYFNTVRGQALTLSASTMVIDAMRQFKADFKTVAADADIAQMRSELASYYKNQFGVEYSKRNNGASIDTQQILGKLDNEAIALQYHYIKANSNALGNKHRLDAASDDSAYSELHKKYHPPIREFLEEFGYHDIFLVDSESGDIVYSVYKEVDYATSFLDGPYAESGLGEAFRSVHKVSRSDAVAITDFAAYKPSYQAPAAFIASPIIENGKNIGVLVLQMPIDRINAVMTSDKKWQASGLGKSGETYLVGEDLRLRSQSRFLIEDKPAYLTALKDAGVNDSVLREIDSKDTSISLQKVDSESARQAIAGKEGYHIINDYRDVPVLSAFTPVSIPGLKWGLIAEIDEAEAFASLKVLESDLLTAAIVICLVIAAIAVAVGIFVALGVTRPIVALSKIMGEVETSNDLTLRSSNHSKDEIGMMAAAFNSMLEKFEALIQQVNSSSSQLAAASEEVSAVARDSSNNVTQQVSETEQVATAMNEMAATVQEVARNAAAAAEAARSANDESSNGKRVVQTASNTIQQLASEVESAAAVIHELEQDSENIGTVLDVIKSIAEQTNLLALNAAIEAARAGEQGRGFAVVADEVRTLASRTQASTQEIQGMIEKLQGRAKQAVTVMEQGCNQAKTGAGQANEASHSLEVIASAVATISDMNTQIASAAEEQSAVTEEMNRNIININHVSEQTAAGAEQTTAASDELARLASELQSLIAQFKI